MEWSRYSESELKSVSVEDVLKYAGYRKYSLGQAFAPEWVRMHGDGRMDYEKPRFRINAEGKGYALGRKEEALRSIDLIGRYPELFDEYAKLHVSAEQLPMKVCESILYRNGVIASQLATSDMVKQVEARYKSLPPAEEAKADSNHAIGIKEHRLLVAALFESFGDKDQDYLHGLRDVASNGETFEVGYDVDMDQIVLKHQSPGMPERVVAAYWYNYTRTPDDNMVRVAKALERNHSLKSAPVFHALLMRNKPIPENWRWSAVKDEVGRLFNIPDGSCGYVGIPNGEVMALTAEDGWIKTSNLRYPEYDRLFAYDYSKSVEGNRRAISQALCLLPEYWYPFPDRDRVRLYRDDKPEFVTLVDIPKGSEMHEEISRRLAEATSLVSSDSTRPSYWEGDLCKLAIGVLPRDGAILSMTVHQSTIKDADFDTIDRWDKVCNFADGDSRYLYSLQQNKATGDFRLCHWVNEYQLCNVIKDNHNLDGATSDVLGVERRYAARQMEEIISVSSAELEKLSFVADDQRKYYVKYDAKEDKLFAMANSGGAPKVYAFPYDHNGWLFPHNVNEMKEAIDYKDHLLETYVYKESPEAYLSRTLQRFTPYWGRDEGVFLGYMITDSDYENDGEQAILKLKMECEDMVSRTSHDVKLANPTWDGIGKLPIGFDYYQPYYTADLIVGEEGSVLHGWKMSVLSRKNSGNNFIKTSVLCSCDDLKGCEDFEESVRQYNEERGGQAITYSYKGSYVDCRDIDSAIEFVEWATDWREQWRQKQWRDYVLPKTDVLRETKEGDVEKDQLDEVRPRGRGR